MSLLEKLRFHLQRFSGEIVYASVILLSMILMVVALFPGEDQLLDYFDLVTQSGIQGMLGMIGGNAPAWILWLNMQLGPYLFYLLSIVGIKIGARIFPTTEDDGRELLVSTPQQSRLFYLENVLAASLSLIVIAIPAYVLLVIMAISKETTEFLDELLVIFVFELCIAFLYMAGVSLLSILKFSKSAGLKLGYGYLIFSMLMELSLPMLDEERKQSVNMSFNYYLHPSTGLITGEFNWEGFIVLMILALGFIAIATLKLPSRDFNEPSKKDKKDKVSKSWLSPTGSLARKYPLIFDQFRRDGKFTLWWTILVAFSLMYITIMYTTMTDEQISDLFSTFDSPQTKGLMHGHILPASFTGFFAYEVLGMTWLWFGLFIVITSVNIANREISNNTQDIIWGTSISQHRLVIFRMIAVAIEFSLMYILVALGIIISAVSVAEISVGLLIMTFLVGWIHYLVVGIFLAGISMLFKVGKGRIVGYTTFLMMLMFFLSASSPGAEAMKYLSLITYYDPIGILLEINSIAASVLQSLVILIISLIIFFLTLKFRYSKQDML
ncbi:MAG: hypothetical protein INQ03_25095 [Candidatus Heimdallarchaeota archaeon]|nr:hypothetical protein [Candidatus Heimdallarchaeota archaeon]